MKIHALIDIANGLEQSPHKDKDHRRIIELLSDVLNCGADVAPVHLEWKHHHNVAGENPISLHVTIPTGEAKEPVTQKVRAAFLAVFPLMNGFVGVYLFDKKDGSSSLPSPHKSSLRTPPLRPNV